MSSPQVTPNPFAGYSDAEKADILVQLGALKQSGKINPAQASAIDHATGYLTPTQNAASMRPNDVAAQAMKASGISGQQQLGPAVQRLNMQEQGGAGALVGRAINNQIDSINNEGHFFSTLGGDVAGAVKGGAQAALNAYKQNPIDAPGQLARNALHSAVQSAQNPMDSSADTTGRIIGANVEGIRDAASKQDYTALLAHSVLPVSGALAAYRGVADVGPQDVSPIPSATRAGQNISEVESAVGDKPINMSKPGAVAQRAQEIADAGTTMPKVMKSFLRRMAEADTDPMTFSEGRDFYKNATRLSSGEYTKLTGPMQRQVNQFTDALGDSLTDTAAEHGSKYTGALAEYEKAMKLRGIKQDVIDKILMPAVKAIPYGAGAAAGGGLIYEAHKVLTK